MRRRLIVLLVLSALLVGATAATSWAGSTVVPGHQRYDQDGNGIPDAGVFVTGHYTSVYAYDMIGYDPVSGPANYYWDLGDGRIYRTVDSIDDLDPATRTVCTYVNNYRADFGNNPYMDTGWIINNINCKGFERGHYTYQIVHQLDPRYAGNPDWSVWGTWEYHVLVVSGSGNLVRHLTQPQNHQG